MHQQDRIAGGRHPGLQQNPEDAEQDQPAQGRNQHQVGQEVQTQQPARGQLGGRAQSRECRFEPQRAPIEQAEPPQGRQVVTATQPDLPRRDRHHWTPRSSTVLMSISDRG